MKKLTIAAVFAVVNMVLATSNLSAGWDDDVCQKPGGGTEACCPQCDSGCVCNMEAEQLAQ